MKNLWPVLSAVACFALPGCSGSSVTAEVPPAVAPVAKPVAPSAAPTAIPVAAPPEMPSASAPEKTRSVETSASSSAPVQVNASQSVESIISQIKSTDDEEGLRKLESELTILKYDYSNANNGPMEGAINALALACEAKRLGHANWEIYITGARDIIATDEREKRNANNPAAQQQAADEWKQRFGAQRR